MLLQNPKAILGFDDRLYVLFGVILNTHTAMAIFYTGAFFEVKFAAYVTKWFGEFFVILILWLVIRALYLQIIKKIGGFERLLKRLFIIPLFLIPYFTICFFYLSYLQPAFDWDYSEFPEPSISVQLITGAIILFADLGFYECILLVLELKNTKVKEERIKKEHITSQLINLKNQVSPHFLFNSLNTLVYLIDTDKEKSKEFVHKLASIYKSVLETSNKGLVTLSEELNHIRAYSELLKERFGENVKFNFEIEPCAKEKKIIPLAIQLGIENAVKHNIISKKQPLNITIFSKDNYLIIENNLQKKDNINLEHGLGLKNITNRYQLLTNKKIVIESKSDDFILKLPLLNE